MPTTKSSNTTEAPAWSPSWAREALRRDLTRAFQGAFYAKDPESYARRIRHAPESIYDSLQSYVAWCHKNIGPAPAPWLGEGRIIG